MEEWGGPREIRQNACRGEDDRWMYVGLLCTWVMATFSLPSALPVRGLCAHRCGRRERMQRMDKMSRICCVSRYLPGPEELGGNPGLVPPNKTLQLLQGATKKPPPQAQTSPVCFSPSSTCLARSLAGVNHLLLCNQCNDLTTAVNLTRRVVLQLAQLCLIYIWIYLEVHVKGTATEGRGRSGAGGTACKMPSAGRSQAPQKAYGWEMSRAPIFSPSPCPDDAKLPAITDYDDYNVSGVYVFVHTCAVVSC